MFTLETEYKHDPIQIKLVEDMGEVWINGVKDAVFPLSDLFNGILSEADSHHYSDPRLQKMKMQCGAAMAAGGIYGELYEIVRQMIVKDYAFAAKREKKEEDTNV